MAISLTPDEDSDAPFSDRLQDARPVQKSDPASKVMGWLRGETDEYPVIMDDKRPYALLNTRQLMARGIHDRTHLKKVAQPVPVLEEGQGAFRATEAFADSLAPYLPVVDAKGRLLGVLTAADHVQDLSDGPTARDAATSKISLQEDDDVDAAMHAFAKGFEDHLPVLDAQGRIAGVLDRTAIMRLHDFQDQPRGRKDFGGDRIDLRENRVKDWMEAGWNVLPEDAPFEDVAAAIQEDGYVFIADDAGRWSGTVTAPGLIRASVEQA